MKILLLVFCVSLNLRYIEGVQGYRNYADGCLGQEVKIQCDPGNVIRILQAFYGRSVNGERYCAYNPRDNCTETTMDVEVKCTGKEDICVFDTGTTTHSQCGGLANYIAVEYECMAKDQMINICSSTEVEDRSGYIVSPNFPALMGESSVQCKCTIRSLVPGLEIEISEVFVSFRYNPSTDCSTWLDAVEVTDGTQSERYCKPGKDELISTVNPTNVTLLHKSGTGGAMWLLFESPPQNGRVLVRCGAKAEEPFTITTTAAPPTSVTNGTTALTTPTTQSGNDENITTETTTTEANTTANATTIAPDVNNTRSEADITATTSATTRNAANGTTTLGQDEYTVASNETTASTIAHNSTTERPEDDNETTTTGVVMVSQFGVTAAVVGAIIGGLIVVFLIIIVLIVVYFKRVNSKEFA